MGPQRWAPTVIGLRGPRERAEDQAAAAREGGGLVGRRDTDAVTGRFRVLGFRVSGLGFRVQGPGSRV